MKIMRDGVPRLDGHPHHFVVTDAERAMTRDAAKRAKLSVGEYLVRLVRADVAKHSQSSGVMFEGKEPNT